MFIRKFSHALHGVKIALRLDASFKIEVSVFVVVIFFGLLLGLSDLEWVLILISSSLVLSLELVNTAVEKTMDVIHPEIHDKIKFIKDILAGAVLISVISAVIVGYFIFMPHIFE